jgi:dTDP-4-amino-4,6-dideoxygalactose transaminase
MKKISLSDPFLNKVEKTFLVNCYNSTFISSVGKNVEKFENEIKKYVKSKFCNACINGTAALHVCLRVLNIKKDDEIIVPSLSFIATANAVLYNNAIPVFMDSDKFLNISEQKTIEFLETQTIVKNKTCFNRKTKRPIKALIVAHMYGRPSEIKNLIKVCKKKNIKIIEDAAESFGSFYKKKLHTGLKGDIGCFSFNGNKIITSGGGGAIVTNNKNYYLRAKNLINQSKIKNIDYIHNELGYNYRLSNLHASIGLGQISKLNKILRNKKKIFNFYRQALKKFRSFTILENPKDYICNNWIIVLKILNKKINYKALIKKLSKHGVECRPTWYPLTNQRHLKRYQKYKVNRAIIDHKSTLCVPSSAGLKKKELQKVIRCLKKYD